MTGWLCLALGLAVAFVGIASGRRRPTGLGWMALFVLLGIAVASGVFVGRQFAPVVVPPTVVAPVVVPPVVVPPVVVAPTVVPPVVVAPTVVDVPPTARPLADDELQALVIDLRTAVFPTDQLNLLVRRARTFTFTPTQAARVLLCFTFDDDRLGALEVLAPRIDRSGPLDPVLDTFRGPFGSVDSARMILGLP